MVNEITWGYIGFAVVELVLMIITLTIAKAMTRKSIDAALKVSAQIQQTAAKQVQPVIEKVIEETWESPVVEVKEEPKAAPVEKTKEMIEIEKLKQKLKEAEDRDEEKETIVQEEPQPQEPLYICPHKDCVKEFATEEKMRRHYGMSHYKDMAI